MVSAVAKISEEEIKMKISGIIPVHNEEKMLSFTLPFYRTYALDELVVVLDRCTDKSENLISDAHLPYNVRFIRFTKHSWKFPIPEVLNAGFSAAKGDFLYSLAADFLCDTAIFKIDWNGFDIASFTILNYPLNVGFRVKLKTYWMDLYRKIYDVLYPKLSGKPSVYGLYAFRKSVLNSCRVIDGPGEEVTFVKDAAKQGFRYKLFRIRNYHVRPLGGAATVHSLRTRLDYESRKETSKYPLWKVLGHAVLFLSPDAWREYVRARMMLKS